jgi:ATP-dependent exoDNAse (exonuclease V) alpha subunit
MLQEMFYKYFIIVKKLRPDIVFIMCGDFRQLPPVMDRVGIVDYKNSVALNELCDANRLQLSKCRRSDDVLFNMCKEDNIMSLTKSDFKNEFKSKHISFTNMKRRQVNTMMMDMTEKKIHKTCSEKKVKIIRALELKAHPNDPNSQDVKLFVGTPVIARVNNKSLEFVNNEEYTITKITDDEIYLTNSTASITIDISKFQKLFYVAYCITTHKSQGMSINGPYTIHEFEKYSPEMRYVALSRSTKLEYINVI